MSFAKNGRELRRSYQRNLEDYLRMAPTTTSERLAIMEQQQELIAQNMAALVTQLQDMHVHLTSRTNLGGANLHNASSPPRESTLRNATCTPPTSSEGGVRPKPPSPPNPLREHDDRTIYRASLEGALGGNKRRRKASRAGASVNMLKVPQHEVPAHHPPPGHQLVTLTVGNGEYTLRPYEEDPLTPPAFRRPTITLLTPAQIGSFQRLAEYWTKGLPECRVEPLCNATLD
eukprot:1181899-Prorocentrum_minimum.AAC.2